MFTVNKLVSKKSGKEYVALCWEGKPICFDKLVMCECAQVLPSKLDELKVGEILPCVNRPYNNK